MSWVIKLNVTVPRFLLGVIYLKHMFFITDSSRMLQIGGEKEQTRAQWKKMLFPECQVWELQGWGFLAAVWKKTHCKIGYLFYHVICSSSFLNVCVESCVQLQTSAKVMLIEPQSNKKMYFFSCAVLSFSSTNLCGSSVEQICLPWCALRTRSPAPAQAAGCAAHMQ